MSVLASSRACVSSTSCGVTLMISQFWADQYSVLLKNVAASNWIEYERKWQDNSRFMPLVFCKPAHVCESSTRFNANRCQWNVDRPFIMTYWHDLGPLNSHSLSRNYIFQEASHGFPWSGIEGWHNKLPVDLCYDFSARILLVNFCFLQEQFTTLIWGCEEKSKANSKQLRCRRQQGQSGLYRRRSGFSSLLSGLGW